ncbi:MAG: hypothetical protein IJN92_03185 [Lachnospiraceae bacterium]|nr:hypothetical protein [Lachnospiraceae bacterium]
MKEFFKNLFIGEVELTKRELWLMGGLCFFAGIVIGFVNAPWTHGVTIGSNNGNNNRGNNACLSTDDEENECIGVCECEA